MLRIDTYLGHWFSVNDSLRNIKILRFTDTVSKKIDFVANGNAFLDVANSIYRPAITLVSRDSGYLSSNGVALKSVSQGLSKTLSVVGAAGDGEVYGSGRRQQDSNATFNRFFAVWNDTALFYVNGNEVTRLDTNGLRVQRDVILNNGGNLTAPSLKFKIIDVAGGSAPDSVSIGITAGALGVRAIAMSNPIQLPSITSNNLSGKSRLLTASGDTLIFKDESNVINRVKLSGASAGQALGWSGSAWVPTTISGGGGGSGNGVRLKRVDGSVNIYPDTTISLTDRNFTLSTGVGSEGIINTIQNIDSTASFKVRTLTVDSTGGSAGNLKLTNGTGKIATINLGGGNNNTSVLFPDTSGTVFLANSGQTVTAGVWNGTQIGYAYTTHMSGANIGDSINTKSAGDTIAVPWYFTGGMSSYNSGSANSLRFGRGAVTATDATAVGDLATASGTGAVALGYNANSTNSNTISIGKNTTVSGISAIGIGVSVTSTDTSSIAIGNTANASSRNGIAIGLQANANGKRTVVLGAGSSAGGYDSSVVFNTTATGKHHIETASVDTLVLPSGKVKANGRIVSLDWTSDSIYIAAGATRKAKYISGLTTYSKVRYFFQDSRPAQVLSATPKAYTKTDSIIIEAYQTFDLDSAYFYVEYRQ